MQEARHILLDEPMAGMSRGEKDAMIDLIRNVRSRYGVSFVVVEHDMPVIMEISAARGSPAGPGRDRRLSRGRIGSLRRRQAQRARYRPPRSACMHRHSRDE
jgi:ABC-type nitrate/sulfonate/bicarbonate transport system ATPase subunit